MNVNAGQNFLSILNFFKSVFITVINWLDGIKLFGSTSVLDINIAITVFGILFTAVFAVVRSSVNNSIGSVDRSRRSQERAEK